MSEETPPNPHFKGANVAVLFVELLEDQINKLTNEELALFKRTLAQRSNIHQSVYQNGLRQTPPVDHAKNHSLAEIYVILAVFGEAVRQDIPEVKAATAARRAAEAALVKEALAKKPVDA